MNEMLWNVLKHLNGAAPGTSTAPYVIVSAVHLPALLWFVPPKMPPDVTRCRSDYVSILPQKKALKLLQIFFLGHVKLPYIDYRVESIAHLDASPYHLITGPRLMLRRKAMLHKFSAVILLAAMLAAAAVNASESDGNKLLSDCSTAVKVMDDEASGPVQITSASYCLGHVRGANDMHTLYMALNESKPLYCMPASVTVSQMVRIIVKYLKENPAKLHADGTMLIAAAFRDAYACS